MHQWVDKFHCSLEGSLACIDRNTGDPKRIRASISIVLLEGSNVLVGTRISSIRLHYNAVLRAMARQIQLRKNGPLWSCFSRFGLSSFFTVHLPTCLVSIFAMFSLLDLIAGDDCLDNSIDRFNLIWSDSSNWGKGDYESSEGRRYVHLLVDYCGGIISN